MQSWHKQQSNSCWVKWNPRSPLQLLELIQNTFLRQPLLSGTLGNPYLNTTGMCTSVSGINTSGSVSHKKYLAEERQGTFVNGRCHISRCISWKTGNGTVEQVQSPFPTWIRISCSINYTKYNIIIILSVSGSRRVFFFLFVVLCDDTHHIFITTNHTYKHDQKQPHRLWSLKSLEKNIMRWPKRERTVRWQVQTVCLCLKETNKTKKPQLSGHSIIT